MEEVINVWEIVKNIHNESEFAALIATVVKRWCDAHDIDMVSYLQAMCECAEEVERLLDND
jgi:hypothetical protein